MCTFLKEDQRTIQFSGQKIQLKLESICIREDFLHHLVVPLICLKDYMSSPEAGNFLGHKNLLLIYISHGVCNFFPNTLKKSMKN